MRGAIIWRCRQCGNKTKGTCKCPSAKYSIVYWVGKRQRWEAVSKTKKDAERRLAEIMAEIHVGAFREIKQTSFTDFSSKWLQDYAATHVKPSTLKSYKDLVRLHLLPAFRNYLLTQICCEDIQSFMAKCLREKKLSPRTTNYLLMVLKMMFKHARQWNLIRENPAEDIKKIKQEHKEMEYLQPSEVNSLLKYAEEPYRTLFMLAAFTGMRRGEVLGLQWGDIDWRSNQIYVRRSLYWQTRGELEGKDLSENKLWSFSSPKSRRSIRTIIMSPMLRKALQIHRIKCCTNPYDLVFCSKVGTPLDPNNMVKQQFQPTLDRAEIRRIPFHGLRHTYTALLIAQGAHVKFIQSQLGHASIQTTMDLYGHLLPQSHCEVGEALDQQIFASDSKQKSLHPASFN